MSFSHLSKLSDVLQFIARLRRRGQKKSVVWRRLIIEDSIDCDVIASNEDKTLTLKDLLKAMRKRVKVRTKAKKKSNKKLVNDIVQVKNPKTNLYTKINRSTGKIIARKKSAGKYKGIPVARKRKK